MGDVHGGLLKCVLQLAACGDKLQATDELLEKRVAEMQRDLPLAEMPTLKSTLAVVPVNPEAETQSKKQQFEEAYNKGTEAAERLELKKARLEKELQRRDQEFRDIVASRNTDIQEEYERMLKELDDQTETLTKEIEAKRKEKRDARKRREVHDHQSQAAASQKKQRRRAEVKREQQMLRQELEAHTREIRELQREFATLEAELEQDESDDAANEIQSEKERQALAVERLSNEIAEVWQEIALLQETQQSIAETRQSSSLKAQYEEEKQEIEEEIAHRASSFAAAHAGVEPDDRHVDDASAPAIDAGGGGERTRRRRRREDDPQDYGPPSVSECRPNAVASFQSCPSAEEGKQAIEEMKKLELIYCYESSGIVTLAD